MAELEFEAAEASLETTALDDAERLDFLIGAAEAAECDLCDLAAAAKWWGEAYKLVSAATGRKRLEAVVCETRCRLAVALSGQGLSDAALAHARGAVDALQASGARHRSDFSYAAALAYVAARSCAPPTAVLSRSPAGALH